MCAVGRAARFGGSVSLLYFHFDGVRRVGGVGGEFSIIKSLSQLRRISALLRAKKEIVENSILFLFIKSSSGTFFQALFFLLPLREVVGIL